MKTRSIDVASPGIEPGCSVTTEQSEKLNDSTARAGFVDLDHCAGEYRPDPHDSATGNGVAARFTDRCATDSHRSESAASVGTGGIRKTQLCHSLASVELGDGEEGLLSLPAGSVALVLSDLPSGETAAEFDRKPEWDRFWSAVWHALKPNGQAVLMASSLKFAAELLYSQRKYYRYELIWEKPLAVGFLNAKKAPLRAHEHILVFSRRPGTYNPQMLIGFDPINGNSRPLKPRSTIQITESYGNSRSHGGQSRKGATDRYPRSVLHDEGIPTSGKQKRAHPQQKSQALLRRLVRQYSNLGDLVADPRAGSGSTGAAAESEGRPYRCWDSSPRFGRVSLAATAVSGSGGGR